MKKSELKEAIKAEITSVLSENTGQERYDALNDNEQDVAILNGMTKKYGKDVVLYWLTSGNYGSLDETISEEIQVGDIVTLGGDGDELKVIDKRRMFGSDMMAYRVKFPDGNTEEYSGDQLRPARMMNEDEDEDDKKAYKGAAKRDKKKSARDKAIDAYNEIGGSKEVKAKAKEAKEGDKEALNWLKSNQKVIKAYNDIPK